MFVWGAAAEGNVEFLRKIQHESAHDLHLGDELCRTPLMLAAANNRQNTLRFLLDAGAKVDSVDKDSGWNALHHALDRGCLLTAAVLVKEGGDVNFPDYAGATPLDLISSRAEAKGFQQPLLPSLVHRSHSDSSEDVQEPLNNLQNGSSSDFMFTLGYSNNYQLGYAYAGDSILQLRPRLLESSDEKITGISVSGSFNTMVNGKGDVYVWGHGVDGLLGSGAVSGAAVVPQKVQLLTCVEQVSLESSNAAALNDKGEVYMWGRMHFWTESSIEIPVAKEKGINSVWALNSTPGRVGFHLLESTLLSRPIKLNFPKGPVVCSITAAANALYFVTADGGAWVLGQRIDTQRIELTPRPIQALQTLKVQVSEIAANTSCVCALTSTGEVFQQDFLASTFHRVHFPKFTGGGRRPALKVIKVCVASSLFSHKLWQRSKYQAEAQKALALTNRGEVFWWSLPVSAPARGGWPPPLGSPQLGSLQEGLLSSPVLGPLKPKQAPEARRREAQLVGGLAHTFVTDIGVAHRVSAAVTSTGDLYTWGPQQHHHFAANKKTEVALRPKRVTSLSQVSRVFISDEHTVAVVRVKNILIPDPQDSERGVPSLQAICEAKLMEQVEPKTVIAAFKWSVQRNWIGVAEFCARFLLSNISMFLEQVLKKLDETELFVFQQCYYAISPVVHTRLPPSFYKPAMDISDSSLRTVILAALSCLSEEKHQESRQEMLRAELVARQVNHDLELGQEKSPTFFDGGGEEGRLARIRTLKKKLSQIQVLRERQARGEGLDAMQQEKLVLETALKKELATLCADHESASLTSPVLISQSSATLMSPSSLPLSSPVLSPSTSLSALSAETTPSRSSLSVLSPEFSSTRKARWRKDSEKALISSASLYSPVLSSQSSVQATLHMMSESSSASVFDSSSSSPLSSSSSSSSSTTTTTAPATAFPSPSSTAASPCCSSSSSVTSLPSSLVSVSASASPIASSPPPRTSRAPSFAAIQAAQLRSTPPVVASKPPKPRPKPRPQEASPASVLPMSPPWASVEPCRSGSFATIQKAQASACTPPTPSPVVRPPVRTEPLESFSLGANASSKTWHPVERALTSLSALQKVEESKKGSMTPSVWFNKSESGAGDLADIQTMELVEQLVLEEQKQLEQEIEAAIALGKQRELEAGRRRGGGKNNRHKQAIVVHASHASPSSSAAAAAAVAVPGTSASTITPISASLSAFPESQQKSDRPKDGRKRGGAEGRGIWNSKTYNRRVSTPS